jgi:hypothetical protein
MRKQLLLLFLRFETVKVKTQASLDIDKIQGSSRNLDSND